jgi:hypothetical protein
MKVDADASASGITAAADGCDQRFDFSENAICRSDEKCRPMDTRREQ